MKSRSSYTVYIARIWFCMCVCASPFFILLWWGGRMVGVLKSASCLYGGSGEEIVDLATTWCIHFVYLTKRTFAGFVQLLPWLRVLTMHFCVTKNAFLLLSLIFLLKSNVRLVSWRWRSLWATNIHEFLWFLLYDAAAGYLGVVRKKHPLHLP